MLSYQLNQKLTKLNQNNHNKIILLLRCIKTRKTSCRYKKIYFLPNFKIRMESMPNCLNCEQYILFFSKQNKQYK